VPCTGGFSAREDLRVATETLANKLRVVVGALSFMRSCEGESISVDCLAALENQPDVVESTRTQVLLPDPEIDATGVSPHPPRPLFISVDLQQKPPVACAVAQTMGAFRFVSVSVAAVNAVRCQLTLEFHFSLNVLGGAEHSMLCRVYFYGELFHEFEISVECRALIVEFLGTVSNRQVQARLDSAQLSLVALIKIRRQLGPNQARATPGRIDNPAPAAIRGSKLQGSQYRS
jgi:hypothetical protein